MASSSLRSDARENRDRLLDAAAAAFARDGAEASLKDIARDADVGIGTLYRRFPTRASLVEATYRSETTKLVDAAGALLLEERPTDALLRWLDLFIDFMASKAGMSGVLAQVLTSDGALRMQTRDLLTSSLARILAEGWTDGSIRLDAAPDDLLMAAGGVALIAGRPEQRDLAHRLNGIVTRGVTR